MLVKQKELADMLDYTEGGVSLAVKRNKITRTPDGYIDLSIGKNYDWVCDCLAKQGRDITQDKKFLSRLRPITENEIQEKSAPAHADKKQAQNVLQNGTDQGENHPALSPEQIQRSKNMSKSEEEIKHWRARNEKEKFEGSRITNLQKRGELIKINPYAKFLESILSGNRTQILNSIRTLSTGTVDIVKTSLGKEDLDAQIILKVADYWTEEIEKIYKSSDSDLKARIRQIKSDARKTNAGKE